MGRRALWPVIAQGRHQHQCHMMLKHMLHQTLSEDLRDCKIYSHYQKLRKQRQKVNFCSKKRKKKTLVQSPEDILFCLHCKSQCAISLACNGDVAGEQI